MKGKCDTLAKTNGGSLSPTVMEITGGYSVHYPARGQPHVASVSDSFNSFQEGRLEWPTRQIQ